MKLIFTSNTKHYCKINNQKVAKKLDNTNNIVNHLKEYITNYNTFLFIASDPNDYDKIDSYSKILFEGLSLSGINFNNYLILDNRTISKTKEFIESSDVIFLSGGNTYIQSVFFKNINLKELLKDYPNLIIGQSAGSINLASNTYNSPEEGDNSEPIYFEGLSLSNLNIEPHFIKDDSKFNELEQYRRNHILNESQKRPIYALCDGSHIIETDNNITIYGESYLINKGLIYLLCKNQESYNIKKEN